MEAANSCHFFSFALLFTSRAVSGVGGFAPSGDETKRRRSEVFLDPKSPERSRTLQ